MSSLSTANNNQLLDEIDLSKKKLLVDCGGGDGTNVLSLAKKFPDLKAVVFDQPDVCKLATSKISQQKLEARISVWPGDLFTTSFPNGADAVLLSHLLTIWSPEENIRLLRRIHDSLSSGGHVYVFNMAVENDETGPFSSALGSLYFLCIATGKGRLYKRNEFSYFLQQSGFNEITEVQLGNAHSLWKGKK